MVRDTGFEPDGHPCEIKASGEGDSPYYSPARPGFEVCELVASWPELPKLLQAAIMAIVRTHRADLFTNRGKERSDWSGGSGSPRRAATISGAGASESSNGSQSYRFREQVGED